MTLVLSCSRCTVLVDAVTTTVFNYVRRGLFERDKLTVATMLTLKIMINDGLLTQEEVDYLVMAKVRHMKALTLFGRVKVRNRVGMPNTRPLSASHTLWPGVD